MALARTNQTLPNGLVAPNVYTRVKEFAPRRIPTGAASYEEATRVWAVCFVWDGVTPPAYDAVTISENVYGFDSIPSGDVTAPENALKLAYELLKTHEDFTGATDV